MELVLDANVLFSALIRDSHTRHFLLFSGHSFYTPEFVFEEIDKHMNEIKEKAMLSESEIKEILGNIIVFGGIKIIPLDEFKSYRDDEEGDLASVGADNSINIRWQVDIKELLKYRNIFADPEQFLGIDYSTPKKFLGVCP